MKKNILLILLSATLLSGCELDISIQRFFGLIKEEPKEQQKEEENNENSQENQENNENSGEEQHGGEEEQKPSAGQKYTVKISTSGTAISGLATSAGVQVDTNLSSGAANSEKLTNCLKSQVQFEECISSAYFEKINTAVWDKVCMIQIGTGNPVKDNFNPGTFKINSKAKIYNVAIEAQCYSKELGATDSSAHLKVNNEDFSLEVAENEDLEFKTFTKEFSEGTNSLSLVSSGGRVLLKSLTITWRF